MVNAVQVTGRPGTGELERLADLSARLGRDPSLVQAASGNTSVKLAHSLWIKASGKWLADAQRERIFVALDLNQLRRDTDSCRAPGGELCPSIETAMHALLPHRVVLHVHSVNTIAWAVRQDGREQLAHRLLGLHWQWIPHVASGRPLAREIAKVTCAAPETDVFVLANHGLVVCGDSCGAAEDLLLDVEARVAITPRISPEADCAMLGRVAAGVDWSLPPSLGLHALGTDRLSRTILAGGFLYPCQAIFLSPSRAILSRTACLRAALNLYYQQHRSFPPFFIVEDSGVILNKQITRAEYAMLMGLLHVVQRIGQTAPIRYLTPAEVGEVLNADAYRYRALVENSQANGR